MDTKRQSLSAWLRDAHAMDRAAIDNLERQIRRAEGNPQLRDKLHEYLAQSRQNVRRIEEWLNRLGAQPSFIKDAATRISGIAETWLAGVATDETVKNCLATYAYAQFAVASYTALAAAADACGEPEIRQGCEQMLQEKLATAGALREQLPAITCDYLEREAKGETGFGAAARVSTTIRNNPAPAALAVAAAGLGALAIAAGAARRAFAPQIAHLRDLYFAELQELRSAEERVEALLGRLVDAAEHSALRRILADHRAAARVRQHRLEEILRRHGQDPRAHRDQAMDALAHEAEKMAAMLRGGALTDAGVIASVQMLAHHQIAAYGTAATWSSQLGFTDEQRALHENVEEEKRFDAELTRLAEQVVNREAAAAAK